MQCLQYSGGIRYGSMHVLHKFVSFVSGSFGGDRDCRDAKPVCDPDFHQCRPCAAETLHEQNIFFGSRLSVSVSEPLRSSTFDSAILLASL